MSAERFIADRIAGSSSGKNNISKPIVKIGIIGIALGISVMILTVGIVFGFKNEIISKITGITAHINITNININPSNEPDPVNISDDTLKAIMEFKGIRHIQAIAIKNGIIKTKKENEGVVLKGVSPNYDFTFLKKYMVEGTLPVFTDTGISKQIVVSKKLADRMNVKLNQKILAYFVTKKSLNDTSVGGQNFVKHELRVRDFRVCGIFNTGFAEFDNSLAFVDLKQLQKLNYWEKGEVGSYEIIVKDFNELETSVDDLEELLGYNYRIASVKDTYSSIFSWLGMVDVNGIIIVTLMLIVGGVNMTTALLILILERANMVGLIKSIGMSNVSVRKIFFHISVKLLVRGLVIGNILGIGIVLLQYFFHLAKLDSETYYVDYVPVIFNMGYILILNAGIIASCMLLMFFPTLILTRLTPIRTLRFD